MSQTDIHVNPALPETVMGEPLLVTHNLGPGIALRILFFPYFVASVRAQSSANILFTVLYHLFYICLLEAATFSIIADLPHREIRGVAGVGLLYPLNSLASSHTCFWPGSLHWV
ncbi:hypothetical protein K438DRAFT_1971860 [Mycena galopus ATCC 62051]|nr:hypothetical protein K438DRAFT_1971860 [Mycena galopus ATCC 62051]